MANDPFFSTPAWWRLRAKVKAQWKRAAAPCGLCRQPLDWVTKGAVHVDHVRPRRTHPHLALSQSNLMCVHAGCHNSTKKRMEAGTELPAFGADGWPI